MSQLNRFSGILKQVRCISTSTVNLARHSNKRLGRSVSEPPINPAPVSPFFSKLPTHSTYFNKDRFRDTEKSITAEDVPVDLEKPYQHHLKGEDIKFLTEVCPTVSNEYNLRDQNSTSLETKAKLVAQAVSLQTANAKGILTYNKGKCIEHFGKSENDSGSPEVQASVWTLRIRNLERHMIDNHKDKHNQRILTKLYHKRAKMLKYLKRQSLPRYFQCLKQLGVTTEMVEGQISIRQKHV